jgi:succinate dehydrogenase/fumarate reductase flavoprotein subunit
LAEEVNNYLKGINFSLANLAAEIENLRKIMWENASILRSGAGLKNSLQIVNNLKKKIKANTKGSLKNDIQSVEQLRQKIKLKNYLSLAEVLLNAMLLRKESRGSHYRQDFPSENSEYRQNLVIQKTAGQIAYSWEKLNKEN